MNSKYLKQDGLTLIELLVSISLLFLVGTLVFNVLIQGKEYSLQAQSTVSLQQEGNQISTKLTSWHEKNRKYKIVLNKNPDATSISLIPYDSDGNLLEEKQEVISSNRYQYTVCYDRNQDDSTICSDGSSNKEVTEKALPIKIIIKDKKDSRLTFEIKTIISRM